MKDEGGKKNLHLVSAALRTCGTVLEENWILLWFYHTIQQQWT